MLELLLNPFFQMLLLLAANGFFVAVEFALVTVRRSRIHELVESGNKMARVVQSLQKDLDFSVAGAQLGITLASLALGWVAEDAVQKATHEFLTGMQAPPFVGVAVSFIVLSMSHVILGEQVPKSWALRSAEKMAMLLALPFRMFIVVTWPLVALMNMLSQAVLRVLGIPISAETAHAIGSPEEFKILFEQSERVGALEESEKLLLSRSLNLRDMNVANLMVHAGDIEWLDLSAPVSQLIEEVKDTRYARLPVAQGSLDDVLGYVNAKDILSDVLAGKKLDFKAHLHKLMIVPETRNALLVLRDFQQSHTDMAMVMDEYGAVRGLVTIHNVVKAAVGFLPDDDEDALPRVVSTGGGVWLVEGTLPLEELYEITGPFQMPDTKSRFYTLAGLIISVLGRIPQERDTIEVSGYKFEVMKMDNYRVARVRISAVGRKQDKQQHQLKRAS